MTLRIWLHLNVFFMGFPGTSPPASGSQHWLVISCLRAWHEDPNGQRPPSPIRRLRGRMCPGNPCQTQASWASKVKVIPGRLAVGEAPWPTWLLWGIPYKASTRSAALLSNTSWRKSRSAFTEGTTAVNSDTSVARTAQDPPGPSCPAPWAASESVAFRVRSPARTRWASGRWAPGSPAQFWGLMMESYGY